MDYPEPSVLIVRQGGHLEKKGKEGGQPGD